MDVRRFPVLSAEDQTVVEEFAVGVGVDCARALTYLCVRNASAEFDDGPASLLSVRVGTELNRNAAKTALNHLAEWGTVDETTISTDEQGRPPKAWNVEQDRETLRNRVFRQHATVLLEQAVRVSECFEADVADGSVGTPSDDVDGSVDSPSDDTDDEGQTVSLNWRPNGLQIPLFGALAGDEYARRGRAVSFVHREGSDEALSDVVSGTATVGIVGATTLLRAISSGTPVVPVALLYQRAPAVLYTTRATFGEPFERAAQLRGRRVGMPVSSEIGLLGRLFLEQAGVASEATVVDLAGEEGSALRAGDVDAVTGSFSDPHRLRSEGLTVDTVPVAERFPIYGPALVVRRDVLSQHRNLLEDILAGTMAGLAAAKRDPTTGVEMITTNTGTSETQIRRTFAEATDRFATSEDVRAHGWGWQRSKAWLRLVDVLEQVALLESR